MRSVFLLGMVAQICNPNTWEAEVGELPQVKRQPGLQSLTLPQRVERKRKIRKKGEKDNLPLCGTENKFFVRQLSIDFLLLVYLFLKPANIIVLCRCFFSTRQERI